jgi:hypothetical protein
MARVFHLDLAGTSRFHAKEKEALWGEDRFKERCFRG